MQFRNPRQLKDWIRNKEKREGIPANTLLNHYMMERLLERISLSRYSERFIIKGGFLIASMIGLDLRSTLDLDATLKGFKVDRQTLLEMMEEILVIEVDDQVELRLLDIDGIHEQGMYEGFRVILEAKYLNLKVVLKIDMTTGDVLEPEEIEYSFPLTFESRVIALKAYHIHTILAEKIETILARNIGNSRAKDFYDVFMLSSIRALEMQPERIRTALLSKARSRNTLKYVMDYPIHLAEIEASPELRLIWSRYQIQNEYARSIRFEQLTMRLREILDPAPKMRTYPTPREAPTIQS